MSDERRVQPAVERCQQTMGRIAKRSDPEQGKVRQKTAAEPRELLDGQLGKGCGSDGPRTGCLRRSRDSRLCRREGIAASMYYGWAKEFFDAGKRRLAGDTARAAPSDEVKELRRDSLRTINCARRSAAVPLHR